MAETPSASDAVEPNTPEPDERERAGGERSDVPTTRSSSPLGRLASPSPIGGPGDTPLSASQVEQWRTAGFVLVDGLLPPELVHEVEVFGRHTFPAPDDPAATEVREFGSPVVFPTGNPACDAVTLHPQMLSAVSQLLDRPVLDLRLTQSTLWAKYGRPVGSDAYDQYDNNDQRIHVDYPNHSLAHPAPWANPEAVEVIVYYSHYNQSGGGTAVVPRLGDGDPVYPWPIVHSPGIGDVPWINDREQTEQYLVDHRPDLAHIRPLLYEREVHTDYRPGTVLLYRHDTWHRGSPLVPGAMRLVQNLTYRKAECEWISTMHEGWAWSMYRPDQYLERLIATSTPEQRTLLGFPSPDSSYWCAETIEAITARYGAYGFDPAPYAQPPQIPGPST